MDLNEYQALAMRTFPKDLNAHQELAMAVMGLCGESGEVIELVKKCLYHGHALDREQVAKELGDVCWYIAAMCHALGLDLDEVARKNVAKLRARYPEGFSEEASRGRSE